jgi:hypothetical protein
MNNFTIVDTFQGRSTIKDILCTSEKLFNITFEKNIDFKNEIFICNNGKYTVHSYTIDILTTELIIYKLVVIESQNTLYYTSHEALQLKKDLLNKKSNTKYLIVIVIDHDQCGSQITEVKPVNSPEEYLACEEEYDQHTYLVTNFTHDIVELEMFAGEYDFMTSSYLSKVALKTINSIDINEYYQESETDRTSEFDKVKLFFTQQKITKLANNI